MASPFMTGPFVPVAMLNLIRAVLGIHHHRFNLSVKRSSESRPFGWPAKLGSPANQALTRDAPSQLEKRGPIGVCVGGFEAGNILSRIGDGPTVVSRSSWAAKLGSPSEPSSNAPQGMLA